jgi:flagellar hook-basal body complex protein FliE
MINITAGLLSPAIGGGVPGVGSALAAGQTTGQASPNQFLDVVNSTLKGVSDAQAQAATAEQSFAAGAPGATIGKALVSSDRAEVAWSATVAVRNEVVSAYQSIMNMQF